jgi:hypothetical protein
MDERETLVSEMNISKRIWNREGYAVVVIPPEKLLHADISLEEAEMILLQLFDSTFNGIDPNNESYEEYARTTLSEDLEEDSDEEGYYDEPEDQFRSDAEADADALKSIGWGTDEDYGGTDDRY